MMQPIKKKKKKKKKNPEFSRVIPGYQPLAKGSEDSGYEIGHFVVAESLLLEG